VCPALGKLSVSWVGENLALQKYGQAGQTGQTDVELQDNSVHTIYFFQAIPTMIRRIDILCLIEIRETVCASIYPSIHLSK